MLDDQELHDGQPARRGIGDWVAAHPRLAIGACIVVLIALMVWEIVDPAPWPPYIGAL